MSSGSFPINPSRNSSESLDSQESKRESSPHLQEIDLVARSSFGSENEEREAFSISNVKTSAKKNVTSGSFSSQLFNVVRNVTSVSSSFFSSSTKKSTHATERGVLLPSSCFKNLIKNLENGKKFNEVSNKINTLFTSMDKLDVPDLNHELNLLYEECKSDVEYFGEDRVDKALSAIDKRLENFGRLKGREIQYKSLLVENGIPLQAKDPIVSFFQDTKIKAGDKIKLMNAVKTAIDRRFSLFGFILDQNTSLQKGEPVEEDTKKTETSFDVELNLNLSFLSASSLKKHQKEVEQAVVNLSNPKLLDVLTSAYSDLSSQYRVKDERLEALLKEEKSSAVDQVRAFMEFKENNGLS